MSTIRLGQSLSSLRPSLTNGPGWRIAFWLQGCSLRCTEECLNPHLLSPEGGTLVDCGELITKIQAIRLASPKVEGVSVLGGEPTDQAEVLAHLLASVRQSGLSAMVYTGYVYETLLRSPSPAMDALLGQIDILVDGPFLPNLYSGELAWRGSSNQRVLCLSSRYTPAELEDQYDRQRKAFSLLITPLGFISISGLQDAAAARNIQTSLLSKVDGS